MDNNRENLEERLARIRLKNEEIEKKHREAEEDRIKAIKDNAMVVKSPKHPPRQHKYDHVEFVYDNETSGIPSETAATTRKESKKFTEGGGPPPDPVYNFLADSTRDGTSKSGRSNEQQQHQPQLQSRKGESFRRQQSQSSKDKAGGDGTNWSKPVQYAVKPAKNLETNWRNPEPEISEKTAGGGGAGRKLTCSIGSSSFTSHPPPPLPKDHHQHGGETNLPKPKEPELVVEQRGNIQISVSKDGEIQSVKCEWAWESKKPGQTIVLFPLSFSSVTSNRSAQPGTGRVGLPRAITKQQQQVIPIAPSTPPHPLMSQPPPPLPIFHHQNHHNQPIVAVSPPHQSSLVPAAAAIEPRKFSVQDRLAKFQVALGGPMNP